MGSPAITQAEGSLAQAQNLLSQVSQLVSGDANFASASTPANLFPVRSTGQAKRLSIAGQPEVEAKFHTIMSQGQWLESSLGEAQGVLLRAKNTLERQIVHYFATMRVSTTSQLPRFPRVAKSIVDIEQFLRQVQVYLADIQAYVTVMGANLALIEEMEGRMLTMINQNLALITVLLNDICNWSLPKLPSMPSLISSSLKWGGFNFNNLAGFQLPSIQSLTDIHFNTNFSFSQCTPRNPNLGPLFNSPTNSVTINGLTVTTSGGYTLPMGGTTGQPSEYTSPTYIATMQATDTLVIDPDTFNSASSGSLPNVASIISNYSLSPSQYQSNIVGIVSALEEVVTSQSVTDLQQKLNEYVTLQAVVASNYDPNLTAAWLFYLSLNKAGRAGTWVTPFSTQYQTSIQPSVTYLQQNNVPYNNVLGGAGISDAPNAIPLIAALTSQTNNNLLWRLSFVEAALLGYQRCTLWDSAADTTYLEGVTGYSPDYVANTASLTATATQTLGEGTAQYPVQCTYPVAMTANLDTVIGLASLSIAGNPKYQSPHPQFRYTYNIFAEAQLVDSYSQFWRDFNYNLQNLLTGDTYTLNFVIQNSTILNAALNPLADATPYTNLTVDTASRNRNWTPGSVLLTIPGPLSVIPSTQAPTDNTSGWSGGTFDAATFLARPDVQAQSIPTQIAMLRLNQGYANLQTLQTNIKQSVANMVANVQASTQTVASSGWEVETGITQVVSSGSDTTLISLETTVFDQGNYVTDSTTITIATSGVFVLTGKVAWDPTGTAGVRTLVLLQNNEVVGTFTNDPDSTDGFTLGFSSSIATNAGDSLQIAVSHQLPSSQSVVSGSFLGLSDPSSTLASIATPPNPSITLGLAPTITAIPTTSITGATAVSVQSDGTATPLSVTQDSVTPAIMVDGILMGPATAGTPTPIAQSYGTTYSVPNANFTPGSLLYVQADGTLGPESALDSSVKWVVVVGKALTPTSFLFQSQVPFYRG